MTSSISRRDLAAALLEYDNDDESPFPTRPPVSHRDSALFRDPSTPSSNDAQLASSGGSRRHSLSIRYSLNFPLPQDEAPPVEEFGMGIDRNELLSMSMDGRYPIPFSPDNPLGGPVSEYEFNEASSSRRVLSDGTLDRRASTRRGSMQDMSKVDLSTWGLPNHLVSPDLPGSPRTRLPTLRSTSYSTTPPAMTSPLRQRVPSIHLDIMQTLNLEEGSLLRRESDPMELLGEEVRRESVDEVLREAQRVRLSANSKLSPMAPHMVPLPPSPAMGYAGSFVGSSSSPQLSSTATFLPDVDFSNPFAMPAPPPERQSRFDPKARGSVVDDTEVLSENMGRPSLSGQRSSSTSNIPAPPPQSPQRVWNDIPTAKDYGRPLLPSRYSTSFGPKRSSLRPQSLVMPSLLSQQPPPASPKQRIPDGFTLGEKPLPPGSRSSIMSLGYEGRPKLPLSLSQRTFRSSLLIDGKRESDEFFVGGATEEGEVGLKDSENSEQQQAERLPGKLYGTSLIDQLQARKAAVRGQQRAFAGDNRPSMMSRSSLPEPQSPTDIPAASDLPIDHSEFIDQRRISGTRLPKSQSVFGVDQVWERELAKLKIRQEAEGREEAERAAREALEGKSRGRDTGKGRESNRRVSKSMGDMVDISTRTSPASTPQEGATLPISPIKKLSVTPPTLSFSPEKARLSPFESPKKAVPRQRAASRLTNHTAWSSDEDEEGRPKQRSTNIPPIKSEVVSMQQESDDESDDVPLSKLASEAVPQSRIVSGSSRVQDDDDTPLSRLSKSKSSPHSTDQNGSKRGSPAIDLDTSGFGGDSLGLDVPVPQVSSSTRLTSRATPPAPSAKDDDVPLGLRRSGGSKQSVPEDDDVPLGLRHPSVSQRQAVEASWRTSGSMPSWPSFAGGYGGSPPIFGNPAYTLPGQWPLGHPNTGQFGPMSRHGGVGSYPSMPNFGMTGFGRGSPQPPMSNMSPIMSPGLHSSPYPMAPTPPPVAAARKIDSWRQEVAVAPTGMGSRGGSGGSGSGSGCGGRNSMAT